MQPDHVKQPQAHSTRERVFQREPRCNSSGILKVATMPFVDLHKYSVKTHRKRKSATIKSAVAAKNIVISRTIYQKLLTINEYPFIPSSMIEWIWKCDQISAYVTSCYVGRVISRFYRTSSLSCNTPEPEADTEAQCRWNSCVANGCWIM